MSGANASSSNLIDAESIYCKTQGQMKGEATLNRQVNVNLNSRASNPCCCIHACFSFFYFISRILKCFKACCCVPCCSTAALLGTLGSIGSIFAGLAFMGVVGIIPIPMELTKLICNASERQNFYYYNNNLTVIREIGNFSFPPGYRPMDLNQVNRTGGTSNGGNNEFRPSFKIEKRPENDEAESRKMFAALNKNASIRLKAYNKYKNMMSHFIPLSYNIVLSPSKLSTESIKTATNRHSMEMKIDQEVQLFCNHSSNLVHISTKEFSNIELR